MAETYENILDNLKKKIYRPVYFLCGEEPYYIDKIADFAENNILDEGEKDFNQHIYYGLDSDVNAIVSACKAFPMMGAFQLIIIKEAQQLKKIELLLPYVLNPLESTILIICHKYKKPDERKEFGKSIKRNSVYFVSDKVKDYKLTEWIESFVKTQKLKIGNKAAAILGEFLGNDLSKIQMEIEKLKILIPEGSEITPEIIQKNIGISKDYNTFELQNALGEKNILKANQIVDYFGKNDKAHNIIPVVSGLYGYFTKIIKIHGLKDRSERAAGVALGLPPFVAKEYFKYANNYPMPKLVKIMQHLEQADLRAKGLETTGMESGEILKELMFKILH